MAVCKPVLVYRLLLFCGFECEEGHVLTVHVFVIHLLTEAGDDGNTQTALGREGICGAIRLLLSLASIVDRVEGLAVVFYGDNCLVIGMVDGYVDEVVRRYAAMVDDVGKELFGANIDVIGHVGRESLLVGKGVYLTQSLDDRLS